LSTGGRFTEAETSGDGVCLNGNNVKYGVSLSNVFYVLNIPVDPS